jgi:hypothetical protein
VLTDAPTPPFAPLRADMPGVLDDSGAIDPEAIDLDALDWDPEEESEFLEGALGNLYLLTATDEAAAAGAMVPLPVVAASMVVPGDMDEPTDEVLDEVSTVMMRLDEQFRVLAGTGLLDYRPVDEELVAAAEDGEPEPPPAVDEDEDLTRYGQVRLTDSSCTKSAGPHRLDRLTRVKPERRGLMRLLERVMDDEVVRLHEQVLPHVYRRGRNDLLAVRKLAEVAEVGVHDAVRDPVEGRVQLNTHRLGGNFKPRIAAAEPAIRSTHPAWC